MKTTKTPFEFMLSGRDEDGMFTRIDPAAPRFIEFDWELLRRLLGEAKEDLGSHDFALLADKTQELLNWIVRGDSLNTIGRRAVALAWVINPNLFKGESLRTLAKRFKIHRRAITDATGQASRDFHVRNHSQSHAANWKDAKPRKGQPTPRMRHLAATMPAVPL